MVLFCPTICFHDNPDGERNSAERLKKFYFITNLAMRSTVTSGMILFNEFLSLQSENPAFLTAVVNCMC